LKRILSWSAALLAIAVVSPLSAQGSVAARSLAFDGSRIDRRLLGGKTAPIPAAAVVDVSDMTPSQRSRRTHWRKGALIGGALGGILGFVASGLDDADSGGRVSTVGLTVGGAAVGALTGALIGGLFTDRDSGGKAATLPAH
jgi:hypothetical protein